MIEPMYTKTATLTPMRLTTKFAEAVDGATCWLDYPKEFQELACAEDFYGNAIFYNGVEEHIDEAAANYYGEDSEKAHKNDKQLFVIRLNKTFHKPQIYIYLVFNNESGKFEEIRKSCNAHRELGRALTDDETNAAISLALRYFCKLFEHGYVEVG